MFSSTHLNCVPATTGSLTHYLTLPGYRTLPDLNYTENKSIRPMLPLPHWFDKIFKKPPGAQMTDLGEKLTHFQT